MAPRPLRLIILVARLDHTSITVLSQQLALLVQSPEIFVKILEWRVMLRSKNLRDVLSLNDPSFNTVLLSCGALADMFSSAIRLFMGKANLKYWSWLHCHQWQDLKWERSLLVAIPYFILWKLALCFKDSIVCVSYDVANSLSHSSALKARVIHNPVADGISLSDSGVIDDVPQIDEIMDFVNHAHRKGNKVLLSYGLLRRRKNFAQTVRALAANSKISFMIFGEGPERNALLELARELGVSSRFAIFPFVKNPARFCYFVDLYVSNTHSEGFGLANVEAALTGIPVVLPGLSVNLEVLSTFGNAFFYSRFSNSDFLRLIDRALLAEKSELIRNPYTLHKFSRDWYDHICVDVNQDLFRNGQ